MSSDPAGAGLPDVGVLTELAAQFFAALPGAGAGPGSIPGAASGSIPVAGPSSIPSNPVGGDPLPPATDPGPLGDGPVLPAALMPGANLAPSSPQAVVAQTASLPALGPKSAAVNGLPDLAAILPPAVNGRFGGHSLGVPARGAGLSRFHSPPQVQAPTALHPLPAEGRTTSLAVPSPSPALPRPQTGPADVPQPPASPFYFIAESTGPAARAQPASDLVTAQSFGLPGAEDLRRLLAAPSPAPSPGGRFYVLQPPAAEPQRSNVRSLDVHAIRRDFPILREQVNGRPLVWFDNAATTQKPQSVIDRISSFYEHENSNIHRAAHELAARATDAYEAAREKVRAFLNAPSADEVIFVRGTTEAINLVANSWGEANIGEGDEIIVSHLEHHANIVPWQMLAARKGARIKVIPVDDTGQVILSEYQRLLSPRTRLVSVTQVSNALGTVVPVRDIVAVARAQGITTLVDGAQSVCHMRTDVQAIGCDFFVFSGHKVFGPTGIGVVWGRKDLLERIPPWQGGGNMIADVTFERTIYQPPPNKFEAGTGNIADAVGLGAAIDYVQSLGMEAIARYEHDLLAYATHHLAPIPGVRIIGTAADKASVLSFVLNGYSTEEVGRALNEEGIAVRSGHHCAQPILRRFGLEATVRPSLAFYNTCEEVDRFIAVVRQLAGA